MDLNLIILLVIIFFTLIISIFSLYKITYLEELLSKKIENDASQIQFILENLDRIDQNSMTDNKYVQCALLLVQGLYNSGLEGKLKKEDTQFIKEFMAEREEYFKKFEDKKGT